MLKKRIVEEKKKLEDLNQALELKNQFKQRKDKVRNFANLTGR